MTRSHRLDPLLKPGSLALMGATEREGAPGRVLAEMVLGSAYSGRVYPINPRYGTILGARCHGNLSDLPETVEHVVIALGNHALEDALGKAIAHGARAATIYANGVLEGDAEPALRERLKRMIAESGLLVCGINGMGFYNVSSHVHAGIFPRQQAVLPGGITHIAQSGSAFTALSHNGYRLGFNLAVSTGDEISVTAADYMDWALHQPETRVISLFLETVRHPDRFIDGLRRAREKGIPVVVLKIGRSPMGEQMAVTHTGAIAGNHGAFSAICRHYGAIEVDELDTLATTLTLLQHHSSAADGGLAAIFESGGFRELFTDLACDAGIPFAGISEQTRSDIARHLEPGLKAENPLDAWGTPDRFEERFLGCLRALMADPDVGAGAFVSNFRDGYFLSEAIYRVVDTVRRESDKPLAMVNMCSDLANRELCRRGYDAGIPVLDGATASLGAFGHLFGIRDNALSCSDAAAPDPTDPAVWRDIGSRLAAASQSIAEHAALDILDTLGMPVVARRLIDNASDLAAAGVALGYPLVLKTANDDILHKTEAGGVVLGINDARELMHHYDLMHDRLGPRALVCRMASPGVELAIGTFTDPQFGPMVMVAAGGILIEVMADRVIAPCPVTPAEALEMLARLRCHALLDGVRGRPGVDRQSLADVIARVSRFAHHCRQQLTELDMNPVIATPDGVTIVDALIHRGRHSASSNRTD